MNHILITLLIISTLQISINANTQEELHFDTKSIQKVMTRTVSSLNSNDIDNSITHTEAMLVQDKIETKFNQEQTLFKKQIAKYKNTILKNKNSYEKLLINTQELAKQLRLKREEIRTTKQKIKSIQDIIEIFKKAKAKSIDDGININDSISYDGYFIMAIEGKRSISRDVLSSAVFKINSNYILDKLGKDTIKHISLIDNQRLLQSRLGDISSTNPKEININNLGFVVDKYFTSNGRAVLIYATKISLFPFKKAILDKINPKAYNAKYISYITDNNSLYSALIDIEKLYPKLPKKHIKDWRYYIKKTLVSIDTKNKASDIDVQNLIDSYYDGIKNIDENIALNQKELKELQRQQEIMSKSAIELNSLYLQKELLRNEAKSNIRKTIKKLNAYKAETTFTQAMILDRKYTDAVVTLKDITQDLMMRLRDRFDNIEVSLNNEKLDVQNTKSYNYDTRYTYAKVVPYYKDNDAEAIIGAVVILQAKFIPKEVIKKDQKDYLYSPIQKDFDSYITPAMVLVEAGTFTMGNEKFKDSVPVHDVNITEDFYISKYEVTFAQYDKFCIDTKRAFPKDEGWGRANRPVINVSYEDAKAYIKWLNEKTNMNYALPTEAQWEYVSSYTQEIENDDNTTTHKTIQDFGLNSETLVCRYANLSDTNTDFPWKINCNDGYETTAIVGEYQPNPRGIYDMSGNVWEWVEDNYSPDYTTSPKDGSANLAKYDGTKVMRGGSWYNAIGELSTTYRQSASPTFRGGRFGFRLVGNPISDEMKIRKKKKTQKYKYLR
jgi:formylglycine-generating enzyme required for sulfatase activity